MSHEGIISYLYLPKKLFHIDGLGVSSLILVALSHWSLRECNQWESATRMREPTPLTIDMKRPLRLCHITFTTEFDPL